MVPYASGQLDKVHPNKCLKLKVGRGDCLMQEEEYWVKVPLIYESLRFTCLWLFRPHVCCGSNKLGLPVIHNDIPTQR